MLSQFFSYLWQEAMRENTNNILSLLAPNPAARVLDVGCGDGKLTVLFKEKVGCKDIVGVDGLRDRLTAAKKRGVDKVINADLEKKWPLSDKSFDAVISNQVIEHVADIDLFISEIHRILKTGGYCVISTENLSSWHNIFALALGWQDFSHHIIKKKHVGNPFSLHFGEKTAFWSAGDNSGVDDSAHPHVKILTYKSLIAACAAFGFSFEEGKGSGYYPLFGLFARIASRVDPSHSHFITVKMRKI